MEKIFKRAALAAMFIVMCVPAPASATMRCVVKQVIIDGLPYDDRVCREVPDPVVVRPAVTVNRGCPPPVVVRASAPNYNGQYGWRERSYLAPRTLGRSNIERRFPQMFGHHHRHHR